jgi:hypothetical protein
LRSLGERLGKPGFIHRKALSKLGVGSGVDRTPPRQHTRKTVGTQNKTLHRRESKPKQSTRVQQRIEAVLNQSRDPGRVALLVALRCPGQGRKPGLATNARTRSDTMRGHPESHQQPQMTPIIEITAVRSASLPRCFHCRLCSRFARGGPQRCVGPT